MEVLKEVHASPTDAAIACHGDSTPTAVVAAEEFLVKEIDAIQKSMMTRVMPRDVQKAMCLFI
jgi:fatty acid/phospholipid biosynthesis enzyme